MKVTRIDAPPVAQPPPTIVVELTLAEARDLKDVVGLDGTIPRLLDTEQYYAKASAAARRVFNPLYAALSGVLKEA